MKKLMMLVVVLVFSVALSYAGSIVGILDVWGDDGMGWGKP